MARVSNRLLVIEDNAVPRRARRGGRAPARPDARPLLLEDEWKELVTERGFEVEQVEPSSGARASSAGSSASRRRPTRRRVRELLADRIEDGMLAALDRAQARGARSSGRSRRQRHAPRRPGPDRIEGRFTACATALRHERRRRRHARQGGGQDVEGIPVFNTVRRGRRRGGANTTLIFVPARFATTRSTRP
jgi:hypothetical protein